MIITKLVGGLGNQLFQYAAGLSLARKHKVEFKMDLSQFESYKLHAFSLEHFNLSAGRATDQDRSKFPLPGTSRLKKIFKSATYFQEKDLRFDPVLFDQGKDTYLEGYWQTQKYFESVAEELREELSLKIEVSSKTAELASKMAEAPCASIHIRRGDYVSNSKTNQVHGTCTLEYYQRGADYLLKKYPELKFFVFSDDPAWVQENLKLDTSLEFVTHNDAATNYEDLYLMSCCHHHIIANSTFSWWGAWLNARQDKVVIAPEKWFADAELESQTKDLIPEDWVRLPS